MEYHQQFLNLFHIMECQSRLNLLLEISVFSICLAAYIARVLLIELLLLLPPNAIIFFMFRCINTFYLNKFILLLLVGNRVYLHKFDQNFHVNNYEVLIDNHLLTKK